MPLGEELDAFGDANDGMLWVRTAQTAGEGADAAGGAAAASGGAAGGAHSGSGSLRSAIMDAEGDVVFDASMADATLGIPEDFCAQYLHDGWWGHSQRRIIPSPMPSSASRTARSSAPSMRRRS